MMKKLKFSPANAKTTNLKNVPELARFLSKGKVYSLDLLSGWSCPFARECKSQVVTLNNGQRKIQDGPHCKWRCFSASQEVVFPNVYNQRKHNFDLLKSCSTGGQMAKLINDSLPKNLGICRIHVAGDFFNQRYFDAWLQVAKTNPHRLFYAYTKNILVWLRRRHIVEQLDNFALTASYGGTQDKKIKPNGLRFAEVVFSENETDLPIDHDDSHAAVPSNQSFALLLHGTQPKGSKAAQALKELKGKGSYKRK